MKNQEILDDEQLNNGKEVIDKRTEKPHQKTLIYLAIMLILGYGLMYFQYRGMIIPHDFSFYISAAFIVIVFCIVVSFILEFIRFIARKFKQKKSDTINLLDPFWFQIIEGSFAVWILFFVVKSIIVAVAYYSF